MNCFAHYLVMRTWIGSSLMAVLSGLINIVAVQELLTMNQLERAEVEILRKIHLAVDSGGLPVYYELSCGNTHDIVHAESLVANCPTSNMVVADKGYDSEKLRAFVRDNNATPVIPRKGNSLVGNEDIDWCMYKYRHLVENAFGRIKQYRGIATRYEKLERNYHSMLALAFTMMWLPMWAD